MRPLGKAEIPEIVKLDEVILSVEQRLELLTAKLEEKSHCSSEYERVLRKQIYNKVKTLSMLLSNLHRFRLELRITLIASNE